MPRLECVFAQENQNLESLSDQFGPQRSPTEYLHLLSFRTKGLKRIPVTGNTAQTTAAEEERGKGDVEEEEEGGKDDKKWRKEETIELVDFEQ